MKRVNIINKLTTSNGDKEALYIHLAEFYSLTNLSKTTIIRDKLCKRYIHKGAWESKIKAEINDNGNLPATEYKKLVLSKKINDI